VPVEKDLARERLLSRALEVPLRVSDQDRRAARGDDDVGHLLVDARPSREVPQVGRRPVAMRAVAHERREPVLGHHRLEPLDAGSELVVAERGRGRRRSIDHDSASPSVDAGHVDSHRASITTSDTNFLPRTAGGRYRGWRPCAENRAEARGARIGAARRSTPSSTSVPRRQREGHVRTTSQVDAPASPLRQVPRAALEVVERLAEESEAAPCEIERHLLSRAAMDRQRISGSGSGRRGRARGDPGPRGR
jgi:hypothetical protein